MECCKNGVNGLWTNCRCDLGKRMSLDWNVVIKVSIWFRTRRKKVTWVGVRSWGSSIGVSGWPSSIDCCCCCWDDPRWWPPWCDKCEWRWCDEEVASSVPPWWFPIMCDGVTTTDVADEDMTEDEGSSRTLSSSETIDDTGGPLDPPWLIKVNSMLIRHETVTYP